MNYLDMITSLIFINSNLNLTSKKNVFDDSMDDLSIEIELNRIKFTPFISILLFDNCFVLTYRYNIFSDQGQHFQSQGNRYRQGKFTFTEDI